jgi:hypothetical protein
MALALVDLFTGFGDKNITLFLLNGDTVKGQVSAAHDGVVAISYTRPADPGNPRKGLPPLPAKTFTQWVPFTAIARIVTSEDTNPFK